MRLQGVVTTGIYCRADCTARPNPDNVREVRNAAAAMAAGFRPCLLCRPDRLPGLGLEPPMAEVAHAVRLIADGYLDHATTDVLAQRIGYSTRQLVRLFNEHVGASPDFVARARRAHLARRLLDESALSIPEVARAAGFSSTRQMSRVMRALFGFSPTQLRAKRRRDDLLESLDGGLRLRLPFEGPLDVPRLVEYLGGRAIPGVEAVQDGVYRRTANTCGYPGVIELRHGDRPGHVEAVLHLATFGSIVEQVGRARALLGLDDDPTAARRKLGRDRLLGPLIRRQPGLRLPGAWDRFETSIRIIIGQQVSVAGASTVTGALAERLGEPVDVPLPNGLRRLFPGPAALAQLRPEQLAMPRARARTIKAFATAVASGELDLLGRATLDDTVSELCALPGIGPWTAHLIAGRVLGQPDAFPASDLGLRRSAAQLLGASAPLSARELEAAAERWRPFRATAAAYLWMAKIDPRAAQERS